MEVYIKYQSKSDKIICLAFQHDIYLPDLRLFYFMKLWSRKDGRMPGKKITFAKEILKNIKYTSDIVSFQDCYNLCANKENIDALDNPVPQVVWGRRGTGKTTLLKAFVCYINWISSNSRNQLATYVVMSEILPTREELPDIIVGKYSLPIYVYKEMVSSIYEQIENYFTECENRLSRKQKNELLNLGIELLSMVSTSSVTKGISITETENIQVEAGLGGAIRSPEPIDKVLNFAGLARKTRTTGKETVKFKELSYVVNTKKIKQILEEILRIIKIERLYICIDEFSDIDSKADEWSVQHNLAQLIKQTFMKSPRFSLKIAAIWGKTKFHERSLQKTIGFEYEEDIFKGADLDFMFSGDNQAASCFFKNAILNTYALTNHVNEKEKESLANYFVEHLITFERFKYLVCGSQGIARGFNILLGRYLESIDDDNLVLSYDQIYQLIINHYLNNVRRKIPYQLDIVKEIDRYVTNSLHRYFLISRSDYNRCEKILKYLASKNYLIQIPGQKTKRELRDSYKLFLINYGNYLDAIQRQGRINGLRKLNDDVAHDGMLFPEQNQDMIQNLDLYIVNLPRNCQNQYYCDKCNLIFHIDAGGKYECPSCKHTIYPYNEQEMRDQEE